MIESIEHSARSAAHRLATEHGPGILDDVDAALHTRRSTHRPDQYVDPISLGALIVGVATIAWEVYIELRKRTPQPSPDAVTRRVHVILRNGGKPDSAQRDHIIDIVIEETIEWNRRN